MGSFSKRIPMAIVLKSRFGWFGENHLIAFI